MKKALVTGASEGIGRAFVKKLKSEGYAITGVARSEQKLKDLQLQLESQFDYIVSDLASIEGTAKIQKHLASNKYDLLVNNAGVGTHGVFTHIPLEKQMAMVQLNISTLTQLSYEFLKTAKSGDALINVSSALAFMPTPSMALYAATKSFVTSLSEALWYEFAPQGVYVMGLCPGITDTNFQAAAGGSKDDLPKGLAQSPEHVVNVAYDELRARHRPTVLTGVKNQMFVGLSRILPRRSLVKVTGSMMPKTKNAAPQ